MRGWSGRAVGTVGVAVVLALTACGAEPDATASSHSAPGSTVPAATGTVDSTDGSAPADGSGGEAAAPGTTVAAEPGRYVEEIFPEIEQVHDDVVFKTAAEAPGFGGVAARDLMIDVWVPVGDDLVTRPLMIFQFGGGFRFGDRNQLAGLARAAAHRGFVSAVFDYRTGTGWQDEGLLAGVEQDAQDAVAWLLERKDELRFDPDAIVSTGASAGAVNSIHMIMMEPDQADVVLAGVVSLSGASLTGTTPVPGGPPVIMFSGTQDVIVPFRLQTRFCEAYVAAGNVCEQHTYDAGHMGGDQDDIKAKSAEFVRERILRPLGY